MFFRLSGVALFLALSQTALAQDSCSGYVGQNVAVQNFEAIAASFGNVAPKGEFETTAQYQARIAAVAPTGRRVIAKDVEDRKFFQYDADTGYLRVQSFAFHNKTLDFWSAFYSVKADLKASTLNNIGVVILQSETSAGTYQAQNSYGTKATVHRVNRVTSGIFEREASINERLFRDVSSGADRFIGNVHLSPSEAQAIRPQLRIAFVVVPRPPFLVTGQHRPGETTVRNPVDVTERFRILIADIQCGLLLDGKNRVLGAYPTN